MRHLIIILPLAFTASLIWSLLTGKFRDRSAGVVNVNEEPERYGCLVGVLALMTLGAWGVYLMALMEWSN